MQVTIRLTTSEFVLEVEPTDTIERVKQRIEDQLDIKVDLQQLKFAGELLEDAKTLVDYNIQKETILELTVKKYISFSVNTLTGETLNLDIESASTMYDVKKLIEKLDGTPVDEQELEMEGKLLSQNDWPVTEYDIENGIINMVAPESTDTFAIRVKNYSQTFFFEMYPTDTVMEIKEKILAHQGIGVEQQRIIYKGKERENDEVLSDLQISDTTFWLMIKLEKVI